MLSVLLQGVVVLKIGRVDMGGAGGAGRVVVVATLGSAFSLLSSKRHGREFVGGGMMEKRCSDPPSPRMRPGDPSIAQAMVAPPAKQPADDCGA